MSESKPTTVLRSDYRVPDYLIDEVELAFDLGEDETFVEARLRVRRRGDVSPEAETPPLVLDGESLELREIEKAVEEAPSEPIGPISGEVSLS